jgi:hypothetical protein
MTDRDAVMVYDSFGSLEGHRGELYEVLARLFTTTRTRSFGRALCSRDPVLIPTIEASLLQFLVLSCLRSLLGRRTAAFLLRPRPLIEPDSIRHRIKRMVMRLLIRIDQIRVILFLPFEVEPRFAAIANDWIYDPQLWDLHFPATIAVPLDRRHLASSVRDAAGQRRVCLALGRQDHDKGFDAFVKLYADNAELRDRFLFVSGGSIAPELKSCAARLAALGGLVIDRHVDRDELVELYRSADLVWCSYAPDYDQASGIFGRALQMGLPSVVRAGSLLHAYCRQEHLTHIAFDGDPLRFPLEASCARADPIGASKTAFAQGEVSLNRLRAAFGFDRGCQS